MTGKPHNNFFTFVFSQKDLVQDFLTQLTTEIAAEIDINSLELDNTTYVNKALDELYSDIVYSAKTKDDKSVKIALLFEHKSYPEKYPRLQLMDYMLGIWRQNQQDKVDLIPIIPILFYHGERKWEYRKFEQHFDINKRLQQFLPKFDYTLIDLANYSDEFILSLKQSFLINSLIAFKHKNDDDYVRQNYTKIFINLEGVSETELGSNYIRTLTVYIISSTKIKSKEMIELIEKLPPKVEYKAKTTAQQLFEEGIERGIEQGVERGVEKEKRNTENKSIQIAIEAAIDGFEAKVISKFTKIPLEIITLIETVYTSKKVAKKDKLALAKGLIQHFIYLKNVDIATLSKLKKDTIDELKTQLKKEK
ncbi:MAG: Rpn family recombination-promoting nuclease/putative transposase [Saprospiraceae bacterium]|nr:Rpn family recombination-promoting nuclease/putative transposase [Saprospiraceae bacterium]